MQPRINTITVAVADLKRALAFYRDGLGWSPWWPTEAELDTADHAAFALQSGLAFVLYPRTALAQDAQEPDARPSSAEFILTHVVSQKEEVDQLLKRAQTAGATLMGSPDDEPWGYTGKFKDMDGHLWEILWNAPTAGEGE